MHLLFRAGGAAAASALAVTAASAHVVLDKSEASPKAGFKAVFRITHGCDGAATTAIEVKIPEGIIGAKPQPKAGWTVEIAKGPYAKAYAFYHGTIDKGATAITWKGGSLPDDMYDEFVVSTFVSDAFAPGAVVTFPVTQTCANGQALRWIEVPKAGEDAHALKTPAPTLRIVGGDTPAMPDTHHH